MKVVAYSVRSAEKEPLAIANHKKHEITLISNSLSAETAFYAEGKDAAVVFTDDDVSAAVIHQLADLGIRYIATRSVACDHIDTSAATSRFIRIANVPETAIEGLTGEALSMALAIETINNLDNWQGKKCLGNACVCSRACDQIQNQDQPHSHEHRPAH